MSFTWTVYKTQIFFLLFVTDTLAIYTPYGKLKIDYGMSFLKYGERPVPQQWDRNWSLMTPDEKIASLRSSEKRSLRVIAGIEDKSNQYPYVVALGARPEDVSLFLHIIFNNTAFSEFWRTCTGSLISEQWVLTAAHCTVTVKPAKIRYGNMTVPPNDTLATYSNILKILIHPSYFFSDLTVKNDIALLLVNRVRLSVYGRVSAVDYRTLVGLPVKYVGLGSTDTSLVHDQVRNRQYGEAAVAPCSDMIKLFKHHPMLCLIRKCANLVQVSYEGDSGGPLLQAGDIVGVLTGKVLDHHDEGTIVYTATSPFLDWIGTTMHTATPSSEN